jgi:hypothetical protein
MQSHAEPCRAIHIPVHAEESWAEITPGVLGNVGVVLATVCSLGLDG